MEWLPIIVSGVVSLLSVGGLGWIITAKEDKKAKQLDNKKKEEEIEEDRKDEIISDWKDIAEERRRRCEELKESLDDIQARSRKKDEIISELRSRIDSLNTACAVSELLKCERLECPNRIPPVGSSVMSTSKALSSFVADSVLQNTRDK